MALHPVAPSSMDRPTYVDHFHEVNDQMYHNIKKTLMGTTLQGDRAFWWHTSTMPLIV